MHEYRTARTIFGFVEFCAWGTVVVGGIVILAGAAGGGGLMGRGGGILGALPGVFIVFLGILGVMLVQIGRASVDTAEMTGQMLNISKEQLRLAKAPQVAPKASPQPKPSLAKPTSAPAPAREQSSSQPSGANVTEYQGKSIEQRDGLVFVGEHCFGSIAAAKRHIDSIATPVALPIEPVSPAPVAVTDPNKLEHLGRRIEPVDGGWRVDGIRFATVEKARAHIEATTLRAER